MPRVSIKVYYANHGANIHANRANYLQCHKRTFLLSQLFPTSTKRPLFSMSCGRPKKTFVYN